MKYLTFIIFCITLFSSVCFLYGQQQPDFDSIADKIVNINLEVKPGETVIITGNPSEIDLMSALFVAVRKAGGFPEIDLNIPEANKRALLETDTKYLEMTPTFPVIKNQVADCFINTSSIEDPKLFADIPEEKITATRKAFQPINYIFNNARYRSVGLGQTGGIPTKGYAESKGADYNEMVSMFWEAVNTDYKKMLNTAKKLTAKMDEKGKVKLTAATGTNITFDIAEIPSRFNCGRSLENNPSTGPAMAWLPAGEVYSCVNPTSAAGTLVMPSYTFRGAPIRNLKLSFKDGKINNITADNDIEAFKKWFDAGTRGKDILSIIDIGINPDSKPLKNSDYYSWEMAGMVTAFLGNNSWAGGTVESDQGIPLHIAKATLTINNETIVKDGQLVVGN